MEELQERLNESWIKYIDSLEVIFLEGAWKFLFEPNPNLLEAEFNLVDECPDDNCLDEENDSKFSQFLTLFSDNELSDLAERIQIIKRSSYGSQ